MDSIQKIGERLKAVRIARNLSYIDVCKSIGFYKEGLSNIENGIRPCTLEILIKLCKTYAVSPEYILGLENLIWEIEPRWASLIKEMQLRNLNPRQVYKMVERDFKRTEKLENEILKQNKHPLQ
ncbi:helix-turn-helix domain-containing protein [Metabacillus rhizolycopersici]|uniref:Helix-turn-helix domain-containing protein n=1 Tax=Metabacillus rhizolycopersici TaxID=2875709 RepID=A0ABS7UQF1_9BACI|nr:helix-turn-helix transcriptional regulator [Metabacillus rhizolycopersici]MBZ5750523.1 helix-turn-helix domain-containing protein [Metabacillus rhizolycopersici]